MCVCVFFLEFKWLPRFSPDDPIRPRLRPTCASPRPVEKPKTLRVTNLNKKLGEDDLTPVTIYPFFFFSVYSTEKEKIFIVKKCPG